MWRDAIEHRNAIWWFGFNHYDDPYRGEKMHKVIIFIGGVAVGSFVTWRLLKEKYIRQTQEEINEVWDDLIFGNREDADEVLSTLNDLLNRYPSVSIADLKDLVGITGRYTDNKYGWTDIRQAYIERTRDGYILRMPKAIPLD